MSEKLSAKQISRRNFVKTGALVGSGAMLVGMPQTTNTVSANTNTFIIGNFTSGSFFYQKMDDFFGGVGQNDMISRDDALEGEAEDIQNNALFALTNADNLAENYIDEMVNHAGTVDTISESAMYNILWSELKALIYNNIQNTTAKSQTKDDAQAKINKYFTDRFYNWINQYNEWVKPIHRAIFIIWAAEGGNDYLSWNSSIASIDREDWHEEAWGTYATANEAFSGELEVSDMLPRTTITLYDGETEVDINAFLDPNYSSIDYEVDENMMLPSELYDDDEFISSAYTNMDYDPYVDVPLTGDGASGDFGGGSHSLYTILGGSETKESMSVNKWDNLFTLGKEMKSQIETEINNFIDNTYSNYEADDLTLDGEYMDATTIVQQFSDSDGMTRLLAEYLAMGYSGFTEDATRVTVSNDNVDSETGYLLINWNYEHVPTWNYENELNGKTLTVNKVRKGGSYTADLQIGTDADGNPEYRDFVFEFDELENNKITFDNSDLVEDGKVGKLLVEGVEGQVAQTIPEDVTIKDEWFSVAVLAQQDSNGNLQETFIEQPFTVESVENSDEYQITTYNNQTADETTTTDQMDRLTDLDNRVATFEIVNDGGGGGDGDDGSAWRDFFSQKYFGVPTWGWMGGGMLGLGALSRRGE